MGKAKDPTDHEPEAVTWARKKAGLTKTDVARRLGVAVSLVTMIENGDRNCTPAMMLRLAKVLNCPVVVLERKRDVRHPQDREAPADAPAGEVAA